MTSSRSSPCSPCLHPTFRTSDANRVTTASSAIDSGSGVVAGEGDVEGEGVGKGGVTRVVRSDVGYTPLPTEDRKYTEASILHKRQVRSDTHLFPVMRTGNGG